MFSTLFRAEFAASKNCTLFLLLGHVTLYVSALFYSSSVYTLAGISTIGFWVTLIASHSSYSSQRRTRLYTQLPTTHSQVFFASWALVIVWLAISIGFWLVYGITATPEFENSDFTELATGALGIVLLTLLISIAIDLTEFKPRAVQWVYIVSLFLLAVLANRLDLTSHVGIRIDDDSFSVFPFSFERFGPIGILYAAASCLLLLYVNYKVYEKSDSHLH